MTNYCGFLLSYVRYGDNDAILHCFTKEDAYCSFYARGIYSPKNKKKAYLFPLNELAITTVEGQKNTLQNISKIELAQQKDLYQNVIANTIIFFVSDFLNQILKQENQAQPQIYQAITEFVDAVEEGNMQAHLALMFNIIKIQGWIPLDNDLQYLNPETGTFSHFEVHNLYDKEISQLWKEFIKSENPYNITMTRKHRQLFLDSLLVYYHFHFVDFKTPKSLDIIQEIY